jgi:hypothetical protein
VHRLLDDSLLRVEDVPEPVIPLLSAFSWDLFAVPHASKSDTLHATAGITTSLVMDLKERFIHGPSTVIYRIRICQV